MEPSSGAVRTVCDIQIDGRQGAGRPKLTWNKLTKKTVDPQERSTWRSGVRSAMCAASQLPGSGPTDVDDALHLHVNQKCYYDDDMISIFRRENLSKGLDNQNF